MGTRQIWADVHFLVGFLSGDGTFRHLLTSDHTIIPSGSSIVFRIDGKHTVGVKLKFPFGFPSTKPKRYVHRTNKKQLQN